MAGIRAPEKIVKYIADLPRNIESTRELLTLLEKPWNMEKIQGLMKAGSSEMRRLYESEKERLGHAIE